MITKICSFAVAFAALSVGATEYFWTGAADNYTVTNRLNWVLADGTVPETQPPREHGGDATLIFDLPAALTVRNYSNLNTVEYRRLILRGSKNLTFQGYGDWVSDPPDKSDIYSRNVNGTKKDYDFHVPEEIINETASATLTLTGQDPQISGYYTNFINVVNAGAEVFWSAHLQNNVVGVSTIRKRGLGRFRLSGINIYAGKYFIVEQGTFKIDTHGPRNWGGASLGFSGTASPKVFNLANEKNPGDYSGLPASYWRQYVFTAPITEENLTDHDHEIRSDGTASDLVYTNGIASFTFTGRFRGNINLHWSPCADKTLTLSGGDSDTTGAVTVDSGTLALTDGARFSSLASLSVSGTGSLSIAAGCVVHAASVTLGGTPLEPGVYLASAFAAQGVDGAGVLIVGGSPFTVPFNAGTRQTTPLDFSGSAAFSAENIAALSPIGVSLSETPIITNGTLHATNRWAVATFAKTAPLRAGDFTDITAKTCDLPFTWFEFEEGDEARTLYLVTRPVVSAVTLGDEVSKYYMMEMPQMWSDGLAPHAGADYFCNIFTKNDVGTVPEGMRYIYVSSDMTADCVFPGETLTIRKCRFYVDVPTLEINLRLYDHKNSNDDLFGNNGRNGRTVLKGTLYVDKSCKNPYPFRARESEAHPLVLDCPITAPNQVQFEQLWTASTCGSFELLGDNSGVPGSVVLAGSYYASKAIHNEIWVAVTNKNALGGPMPTAIPGQGLLFRRFPKLIVNDDVVFDTPNRLWNAFDSGVRVEVAAGKTLSLMNPYYACVVANADLDVLISTKCALEKSGDGVFALGAEVVPCASGYVPAAADGVNNLISVKAGGLKSLGRDVFDNLKLEFADGTSIVTDPDLAATADYGIKVVDFAPVIAAGAKVSLVPELKSDGRLSFSAAFLTVPAETPDLSASLVPARVRVGKTSYRGKLVKTSAEVDGNQMTVYSADYEATGLMILIR